MKLRPAQKIRVQSNVIFYPHSFLSNLGVMSNLKLSATYKLTFNNIETMARLNDAVFVATQEVFAKIEATAKENVPVLNKDTSERYPGELRDSIRDSIRHVVKQGEDGVRAKLFTKTDAEWVTHSGDEGGDGRHLSGYGGFVELGTAKTRAQPFMWPAFEEHIGELPDAVKAILNDGSPSTGSYGSEVFTSKHADGSEEI
jgi:HK97 gp10 family phage protein